MTITEEKENYIYKTLETLGLAINNIHERLNVLESYVLDDKKDDPSNS